ncbi:unnamed protein product [Moneuplotes crassus]|uniref:Uncharacterized protein n=1 Tax=Euplotes crassus TaxID=5936 RepID=A0AAD1X898_EUPCR|nr:unnamed protein product [Moneuplotes crassus]
MERSRNASSGSIKNPIPEYSKTINDVLPRKEYGSLIKVGSSDLRSPLKETKSSSKYSRKKNQIDPFGTRRAAVNHSMSEMKNNQNVKPSHFHHSRNNRAKASTLSNGGRYRNSQTIQAHQDLNSETVMEGINQLRAESAYLIEKSYDAPEGNYIQGEDADDHIQELAQTNEEMITKLTDIGNQVVQVIDKAKNDQTQYRRKYREEVLNKNKEEKNDPELYQKIKQKEKLYTEVNKIRKEIRMAKLKCSAYATSDKIEEDKSNYKQIIEENYQLYEEIKSLQKIKKQQKIAIQELQEIDPKSTVEGEEANQKMLQMSIEEKKKFLILSEKIKEIDQKLQEKLIKNSKITEETKKMKETLHMLERGKMLKSKKEIKEDAERDQLRFKLENLTKIWKAKKSKHKSDLKVISNKYRQIVKSILVCKASFEEAVQESTKKSKCVLQLKSMVGLPKPAAKEDNL